MFAVRGVFEGYEYGLAQIASMRSLSEEFIKDIHERTALDCQPYARGSYRNSAVLIAGAPVSPADPLHIRDLMADLVHAYRNSRQNKIVRACVFHILFENIHPFIDGNGRTGRTILNLMLRDMGVPPAALKDADRRKYLSMLAQGQLQLNPDPFVEFVISAIESELSLREELIIKTRIAVGDAAQCQ
ncbi:Fic family protein [Arcanobacterium hippocoleae]